jgi:hypothetical protein
MKVRIVMCAELEKLFLISSLNKFNMLFSFHYQLNNIIIWTTNKLYSSASNTNDCVYEC